MVKHKIGRELIEQKVTFMNGLNSEWKAMVSTVKEHEQFKSYYLEKLVGILRSHEDEVAKEERYFLVWVRWLWLLRERKL